MSTDRLHHALLLTTGALTAIVESGTVPSKAEITFTGAFAQLGTVTIDQVLGAADAALGEANAEGGAK